MKIEGKDVKVFKMKNRNGYAAVCTNHLTEGRTIAEARSRMEKALRRTLKKKRVR